MTDNWIRNMPAVVWRVRRTGNYTVVEVKGKVVTGIGVAKRNPVDKPNGRLGFQLALARALRDYGENVEREITEVAK